MRTDEMILVSIDDHVIEPPDLFDRHMPERLRDVAPHVAHGEYGVDSWIVQGMQAVGFAEMRPGCYDIHGRVRDMNVNGVLASMCFPTFAGFAGTWLAQARDKELTAIAIAAYNDWHIDEWLATERSLGIVARRVAELRRAPPSV